MFGTWLVGYTVVASTIFIILWSSLASVMSTITLMLWRSWNSPKVLRLPKHCARSLVWSSSRLFSNAAQGSSWKITPCCGRVTFAPPQHPLLQMLLNTALNRVFKETALFFFFHSLFVSPCPWRSISAKNIQVSSPHRVQTKLSSLWMSYLPEYP